MKLPTLPQKKEGRSALAGECLTLVAFCTFLLLGAVNLPKAAAQNCPAGGEYFELDGNAITNTPNPPPDDWDLVYYGTSHAQVTTGILTSTSDRLFTQGSKDVNDVSSWHWTIQNAPPKDILLNGGAALYNSDRIYFFGDRYAENGDAQIGFWFFKGGVSPLPDGTFSGHHEIGDILLLSNFVNGGGTSQILAYEWVGSGGNEGSLQSIPVDGTNLCALVNSSSTPSPWPFIPKFGPANIFPAGGFFEGGIVLSGLGDTINPCFGSFLLETRASQSLTAELKDFIFGNFFTSPQVSVNSANICIGGTATLTATVTGGTGPFTYLWSNGATTSSITVSPVATTIYTVTVTPTSGCVPNPVSGTVTVNSLPACSIGNLSPSNLICNNGNYIISSTSAASSYSWSMSVDGNPAGWAIIGSNMGQSITFSAGDCGNPGFQVHFALTVTDVSGCTSTCTTAFAPGAPACNVSIRPPVMLTCLVTSEYILASYATDIINPTFAWTLNGGSIGAGINDGVSLDSILISSGGTYRFTVTDPANSANACFGEVSVTQDTTAPGASAYGCTLTCLVTSMALVATSPTAGVTYSWTGPDGFTSNLQDPIATVAGTYTVTVTDTSDGCTSTATATLNQLITPPPCSIGNLSPSNLICNHGDYSISTSLDTSLYSLSWSISVDGNPPGWAIIGSDSAQTLAFSSGNCGNAGFMVHVTLRVTNKITGCVSTCSNTFAPGAPACNVSIRPPVTLTCLVTSEYILASYATDIINPTFVWTLNGGSIGAGINDGVSLDSILISSGGTYRFTVTDPANSANACFGEVSVTQDTTAPGASAYGCTLTCLVTSMALVATSPTAGVTYSWTGPDGFTSNLQDPIATVAGTYTVTVTDTSDGCTSTATATLNQLITPPPCSIGNLSPSNLICNHGDYSISTSLDTSLYSLSWSISVDGNPPGWAIIGSDSAQTLAFSSGNCGNAGFMVHVTLRVTNKITGCVSTCSNTFAPGAPACNVSIRPPVTLTCLVTSEYILASYATDIINPTFVWTLNGGSIGAGINDGVSLDSILISSGGTYRFTVTDPANSANACFGEVSVTQDTTAPGASASGCILTCVETSGIISASSPTSGVSYSWSGPGGFISTLQITTVSIAGIYTVTVTDSANGCTSTATATVAQNITPPGATASGGILTCVIDSIQITAGSTTGGVTFSWSGPGGFTSTLQNATVGIAGTYTVTVTNPVNGCTSTATATVTQNITPPGASASGCILTCVETSGIISASSPTSGVSYSWNGPGGFSSTLQITTVSVAGTYTVTVTDSANGCTSTATATVTQNITPPGASATGGELTCAITSVQLSASSSTGGVSYSWSGAGGYTSSEQNPTVSVAGTYTVTVTNPVNGCTSTGTATVTQNITPPGASATGGELTCAVTSVQLSASSSTGGVSYSWSGAGGYTSSEQNPTVSAAGTYTVTVTNPVNGCISTATAAVTQNITPPGASATGGELTCAVTSVQLSASSSTGGVSYSWSGPGGYTSSEQNTTVSVAGTYTVTVTNPVNGCISTATATVTQNITAPGASATGGTLTCSVTSVQLSASSSTGGVSYSWSGAAGYTSSEQNPTVSAAGTYTVTVTNPVNGCTSTATATVTQNITPPGASATGGELTCAVTSVQLSASSSTGGVSYSWSGPGGYTSSDQNPTVSAAGTYTVTVTNPVNGCTSTATATVTQNITPPGASATGGELTCAVTSVQLSASSTTGGVSYNWSGPGGYISSEQNPTVSVAGTYTTIVTNPVNGCTSTATASVTQNITPPGASATGGELTCAVTSVQLSASSSTGGVSYSWSGAGGYTSSEQNPTVSAAGTYTVTVTNPVNGCISTATAAVTQNITPPGASATGGELTCAVTSVQLSASSSTGGVSYSWSGPGGYTSSEQNTTVSVAGTYTVTVTNPVNGCISTATATVTQNITAPGASATGGTLTCSVTSVQLSASSSTGGVSYSWSGAAGYTSSEQNPTVSAAGTYTVTVTNPVNGCTSTATATVTQNITPPGASATGGELTCAVTSVQLSASSSTGGVSYSWSGPGGYTSSDQNPTVSAAGTYTVTVTNPVNGCTSTATAAVTQNITPPGASATGGELTCAVTSVQLSASSTTGGVSYNWSGPGGYTSSEQNPTVSVAGTYTVTVTNPVNGCISTATATVTQNITAPGASATGGTLTCSVTSVQLSASSSTGGVSYSWSGAAGYTSSEQNPTVSAAGTYTVTVTNPVNGCTSTATATVTQNITPPGASATGGELTCAVTSVQLSASSSTGGVSYSWSGPGGYTSSDQNPTVSAAGTYTVTVTNPVNGCTSTATAAVTQNITPPGASATGGELTCAVTSVQLSASSTTGGVSYNWSGPGGYISSEQNPTVSAAGTYTVTVTNPVNGCTSTAEAEVTQNITPPGASAFGCTLNCIVTSMALNASSPTEGVTYSWTGPGGFTSTQQDPVVSVAGTYTVTVTDPDNGCTSTATATIIQNITPPSCSIGDISPSNLICNHGNYSVSSNLDTSLYSLSWTMSVDGNPSGWDIVGSAGGQTLTFSSGNCGNSGFMVHITLTVTDKSSGCVSTCSASFAPGAPACNVSIRPAVTLTCLVTSEYLLASYATDIVSPTFEWTLNGGSIGAGINDGVSLDSILISSPGTYRFTVTDPENTANTCFGEITVIQDISTPRCNITPPESSPNCGSTGNSLSATTIGTSVKYSWYVTGSGWVITSSDTVNPITYTAGSGVEAGTFVLVVTDENNGCSCICTITINCTSSSGGCTLGFWKTHATIWDQSTDSIPLCVEGELAAIGPPYGGNASTSALFRTTFGLTNAEMTAAGLDSNLTLLQALELGGGGFFNLARQAVAALLNTCGVPGFSASASQILTAVNNAFATSTPDPLGPQLDSLNNSSPDNCPSGNSPRMASADVKSYPNPFQSLVTIEFTLTDFTGLATVEVFNMAGAKVATLFSDNTQEGVTYKSTFNGDMYAAGIYMCRITAADHTYYNKLTLIK